MYRPKFRRDYKKWREVIEAIRLFGINEVHGMLATDEGQAAFPMLLTKEVQKEGMPAWQTYSRRHIEQPELDGLKLAKVHIAPWGGVGKTYVLDRDSAIAYREMIAEFQKDVKPLHLPKVKARSGGDVLEIMLPDHHFGKIAYGYAQESWTLAEAREAWEAAIASHLSRLAGRKVSRIVLPVGNDLLHTNSDMNTTKKGTPMEVSDIFSNLYAFVRDVVTASIVSLAELAPVTVVMVGGNHDEDGVYRLGEYLEGRFHGSESVQVDNRPYRRKHNRFGANLLTHMHGEKINFKDVHNSISNDQPQLFATCKYRYAKIGHLHKSKSATVVQPERDEYQGTEIEICPSLCPTDKWHFDNLYTGNQRRSKAYLYGLEAGKVEEFYFNL